MTLTATFDTFEGVLDDKVAGDEALTEDRVEPAVIDDRAIAEIDVEDDRPEPSLVVVPFFVEFDAPAQLDPERAGLIWELVPTRIRTMRLRSPAAALLFHLLPLLGIIIWPLIAIEPAPPIAVQLVFEQPPPPPPPPPQQSQPEPKPPQFEQPPRGPLSSVDQGVVKQLDLGRTADEVPSPSAGKPQPNPSQTQTATALPIPPPLPVPKPTPRLPIPKPTPPRENQATVHLPKPAPPRENQAAVQLPRPSGAPVERREEIPREAAHSARYAGPAATRDEYLAYLVTLTRQHIDLLPMSVVGDRRGETVIAVTVYEDGTIGALSVVRSSGYPDIDRRIEDMVAAVRKFPPLPQWYQGNAVELELTLQFPEALERTS